jgi:glycosyltransferase involved in cell wall biosynthesis
MLNVTLWRLRILFISPVSPFSLASGSEQRSALIYDALTKLGKVDTLHLMSDKTTMVSCDQSNDQIRVTATLKKPEFSLSRYKPEADFTRKIEAALQMLLSNYDVVVGRYIWPICQLNIPKDVPIISDLDDFRYRYSPLSRSSPRTLLERTKKFLAERLASHQLHRFSAVFFASPRDQAELPTIRSAVLPNIPLRICTDPQFASHGKGILFVGSLWYRPNAEGIDWFLKMVWPQVLKAHPEATLTLVGAAPPRIRAQWERYPHVFAPGFVDDLAAAYSTSALVVVPIHSGGGTNIKVLEALGYGRPCVTTRFTHAAFADQLEANKHLLVADGVNDFAERCIQVLAEPGNATQVARSGYDRVVQHYTRDRFDQIVAGLVEKVIEKAVA